jgi:hypothetical protein
VSVAAAALCQGGAVSEMQTRGHGGVCLIFRCLRLCRCVRVLAMYCQKEALQPTVFVTKVGSLCQLMFKLHFHLYELLSGRPGTRVAA